MYVRNTTGGTLTQTSSGLTWGNWATSPQTQIATGQTVYFNAEGAKGSATGTQGSVTYMFSDNATTFTISFDIPYSSANSGGLTLAGTGASNYTAQETDNSYNVVISFPSTGKAPTVYFAIGAASGATSAPGIAKAVIAQVKTLSDKPAQPSIDIAQVARSADCGEITSSDLIGMFNGKTAATAEDIWAAGNVPAVDRVWFSSNRGLISTRASFTAAVDFAEHVIDVLKNNLVAYDWAVKAIAELRKLIKGGNDQTLDQLADELEDVKALLLAQRNRAPLMPHIAAIDAILTCIYVDPEAALLQAGSCARNTSTSQQGYNQIAEWQLKHLQGM
jgi:hypothetical protein